jgi:hypothetical protein
VKNTALFATLAISFSVVSTLSAQDASVLPRIAAPTEWKTTNLPAQLITLPIVCGSNSKIYLRPNVPELFAGPISMLTLDGESTLIHPANGTGFPRVYTMPFNADSAGNFFAAIQPVNGVQWYLAAYDNEGRFKWQNPIAERFTPTLLLPIRNDRFIVGGVRIEGSKGSFKGVSVVALFDRKGTKLKSLSLSDDDADVQVQGAGAFNRAIQYGIAAAGPDGLDYVFRASAHPKVQVLDADGNVLRILSLTPMSDDAWPTNFFVLGNAIAVAYLESKADGVCLTEGNFTVYNSDTGEAVANYRIPVKGILACPERDFLVFLSANKGEANYHFARTELPPTSPTCPRQPSKIR